MRPTWPRLVFGCLRSRAKTPDLTNPDGNSAAIATTKRFAQRRHQLPARTLLYEQSGVRSVLQRDVHNQRGVRSRNDACIRPFRPYGSDVSL